MGERCPARKADLQQKKVKVFKHFPVDQGAAGHRVERKYMQQYISESVLSTSQINSLTIKYASSFRKIPVASILLQ